MKATNLNPNQFPRNIGKIKGTELYQLPMNVIGGKKLWDKFNGVLKEEFDKHKK